MPPGEVDPFVLLGLEPRFDLPPAAITRARIERSRRWHPDRFATASPTERRISMERTAALHDALKVLSDPVERSHALLRRAGVEIPEKCPHDPMLLMTVMERQEALVEAPESSDPQALLFDLESQAEGDVDAAQASITARLSAPVANAEEILKAGEAIRYHRRFIEEVDMMRERLIGD
ncbi:MAG: hypothetical protein AUJ55_01465 [Proteobacteria bacterium CG1_02_64_396]|nr:MAG: hypothetical protein AUJ55_01465 [Proteobacteria bacterium CG1_02_64_396]